MKKKCSGRLNDYFGGCLYFTAGHLYRLIERLAFEAFRPLGLAPTHGFFLMALNELGNDGASPSELSEIMALDRSTVTRLVGALEKKNLLKSATQGRYKRLTLTAKGRSLLPEVKTAWSNLYQLYSEELGEERANAMNAFIGKNLVRKNSNV